MIELLTPEQRSSLQALLAAHAYLPFEWYADRFGEEAVRDFFVAAVQARLAAPQAQGLCSHMGEGVDGLAVWSPLNLESQHFGFPAASLDYLLAAGDYHEQRHIKEALLRELLLKWAPGQTWHLAARVDARDLSSVHALEARGFHLMDGLITLSRDLRHSTRPAANDSGPFIRPAVEADLPAVRRLAGSAFSLDRLHVDPAIPKAAADRLHEEWLNRSFHSPDDRVWVAEGAGEIAGYAVSTVDERTKPYFGEAIGVVVIVATDTGARRAGVGRALCLAMLGWFCERGVAIVEVGTQLANVAATRLYESLGFRAVSSRLTFSQWIGAAS